MAMRRSPESQGRREKKTGKIFMMFGRMRKEEEHVSSDGIASLFLSIRPVAFHLYVHVYILRRTGPIDGANRTPGHLTGVVSYIAIILFLL